MSRRHSGLATNAAAGERPVSWLFTKLKGLEQPEHTGYIQLYSHDSTPRTQPLS